MQLRNKFLGEWASTILQLYDHKRTNYINTVTNYKDNENKLVIKKIEEDRDNVKIKIMAFDIEADSSHGDFPLPKKDYTKSLVEAIPIISRRLLNGGQIAK